jgi:hypothetical protein
MVAEQAIHLLIDRFPILNRRVEDPDDLVGAPHFAFSLLAAETLERRTDEAFLDRVGEFIDDLANSGDSLLEEVLVIDVLEGIAQDPDLARRMGQRINSKSRSWLDRVEKEFFKRQG